MFGLAQSGPLFPLGDPGLIFHEIVPISPSPSPWMAGCKKKQEVPSFPIPHCFHPANSCSSYHRRICLMCPEELFKSLFDVTRRRFKSFKSLLDVPRRFRSFKSLLDVPRKRFKSISDSVVCWMCPAEGNSPLECCLMLAQLLKPVNGRTE